MASRINEAGSRRLAREDGRGWKHRPQEHEEEDPQLGIMKLELENTASIHCL